MTYRECLDYLFNKLPVYQFIGGKAYKPSLENTLALCAAIGNPQNQFSSIHVAGTNGKGSVSHMLAAVLQSQGYKVGLFTSPHLKDFRERIKINGKPVSRKFVIDFTEKHQQLFTKIQPSFFEMTMAMASLYFAKKKADVVIFETGLGGRLDSTNIIQPELSVITNISLDHQQFLGNTLTKIAGEKAGIIKKNIPVVIGETTTETKKVFEHVAKKNHAPLCFAEKFSTTKKYHSDLTGNYQQKNIRTVLQSVKVLQQNGWKISSSSIRKGIRNAASLTGLLGRWQILQQHPAIVADIAHNEAGLRYTMQQVKKQKYNQLHLVIGMAADKDIDKMLALMPKKATYYFTRAQIPRALNEKVLQEKADRFNLKGKSYKSVRTALNAAKKNAGSKDFIYIGGSSFVVAEVI